MHTHLPSPLPTLPITPLSFSTHSTSLRPNSLHSTYHTTFLFNPLDFPQTQLSSLYLHNYFSPSSYSPHLIHLSSSHPLLLSSTSTFPPHVPFHYLTLPFAGGSHHYYNAFYIEYNQATKSTLNINRSITISSFNLDPK